MQHALDEMTLHGWDWQHSGKNQSVWRMTLIIIAFSLKVMQNVDSMRFLEYSSGILYTLLVGPLTTLCFVNSWESRLLGVQVLKSPPLSHIC